MQCWKGLRILNTRPIGQNAALSQTIRQAGAIPIECPALAIEPVENDWTSPLGDLLWIDKAIFISPNAVHYCFERLNQLQRVWPESIHTTAIGMGTSNALIERGVRVDDVPLRACSESLLELESMQHVQHQSVLLVKGDKGRELINHTLIKRGAQVIPVEVYRRILPVYDEAYIQSLWQKDAIDMIVFTSEVAVHHVFHLFGRQAHSWLRSKPCLVISERLAKIAADFGMKTISLFDGI